jgi:hypothetical protein
MANRALGEFGHVEAEAEEVDRTRKVTIDVTNVTQ